MIEIKSTDFTASKEFDHILLLHASIFASETVILRKRKKKNIVRKGRKGKTNRSVCELSFLHFFLVQRVRYNLLNSCTRFNLFFFFSYFFYSRNSFMHFSCVIYSRTHSATRTRRDCCWAKGRIRRTWTCRNFDLPSALPLHSTITHVDVWFRVLTKLTDSRAPAKDATRIRDARNNRREPG